MKVRNQIVISCLAGVTLSCGQKPESGPNTAEVTQRIAVDVADEVSPPPPGLTSNFKTVKDWLINISSDKQPQSSIATYQLGLFESTGKNTIYLVGLDKYNSGDTSFTRIAFEPSNMYFQLPENLYKNIEREELINKLIIDIKDFANTDKFKTSFLIKADSIVFSSNGETIWSKE